MEQNPSLPTITVIIATYNCSTTLKCAIESVLNQDFKNFEVWVIGDCCTDNSASVVEAFKDPRLNWHNLTKNTGNQVGPNNEGLKRAKGKYIAYLGHDDLWFPNHLSLMMNYLEKEKLDFVHCLVAHINPKGAFSVIGLPSIGRNYSNCAVPPSSWLYKKSITEDCGFWRNPGVDIDYFIRVAKKGKQIGFVKELIVLKFTSNDWSFYSKKDNFPQVEFLNAIKQDPTKVILKILFELAEVQSQHYNPIFSIKESILKLVRNTAFVFIEFYSPDRWPLKNILTYRLLRYKKKLRKKRGLSEMK